MRDKEISPAEDAFPKITTHAKRYLTYRAWVVLGYETTVGRED